MGQRYCQVFWYFFVGWRNCTILLILLNFYSYNICCLHWGLTKRIIGFLFVPSKNLLVNQMANLILKAVCQLTIKITFKILSLLYLNFIVQLLSLKMILLPISCLGYISLSPPIRHPGFLLSIYFLPCWSRSIEKTLTVLAFSPPAVIVKVIQGNIYY